MRLNFSPRRWGLMELFSIGVFCQVCPLPVLGINPVCVWETFTFITCLCPKRLTISTFVIRKKPHVSHITFDKVKNSKLSSPHLSIVAAICQGYLKCISAMIKVLTIWTYKCIYIFWGGGRESCNAGLRWCLILLTGQTDWAKQGRPNWTSVHKKITPCPC